MMQASLQTEPPSGIDQDALSDKRTRTLTERGIEMYEETCIKHLTKLDKDCNDMDIVYASIPQHPSTLSEIYEIERHLEKNYSAYCAHSSEYLTFLLRTGTLQSLKETESHNITANARKQIVDNALRQISSFKEELHEHLSHYSHSSRHTKSSKYSHGSNMSSVLAKKRAAAEGARARVTFAIKEADIQKQKASLDADLHVLGYEKEAAAAEAEAEAIHLNASSEDISDLITKSDISQKQSSIQRTQDYVTQHAKYEDTEDNINTNVNVEHKFQNSFNAVPIDENQVNHTDQKTYLKHTSVALNAEAPPFVTTGEVGYPPASHLPPENHIQHPNAVLTQFLLKKDLITSRLTHFNDTPENYMSWKGSFSNIIQDLHVSPSEELDLLAKWLGKESSRYAISIRASNMNDPARGLTLLWERLDDRYGRPEMVESALKRKLANFPKLSNRDSVKLYDLSDILSEIESVKNDKRFESQLAYYDSSSGVNSVVNKLPYQLQEKWTGRATDYKSRHHVIYPPFSVFCQFVKDMSKIKNDPSFAYDTHYTEVSTKREAKSIITTKKTQFAPTRGDTQQCPLHKTNHSLNKCKGFRAKPYLERKQFLKDNGICYKCCEMTKHQFRDCNARIACLECGSLHHASALHVEGSTSEKGATPPPTHGGERSKESVVVPKCTQICGNSGIYAGKSCAKLILVNVSSKDNPENTIKTYAIIDDQSNRSLARSELLDQLQINSDQVEYCLASCSGTVTTSGRRASGCRVESVDGSSSFDLPTLIECDQIPNIRDEIPTPAVALQYPHLRDISDHIPDVDDDHEILLLIGRDLIDAHHVLDQRTGPPNSPYAHKLCLGWVIVGESCLGKVHRPDIVNVNKTHWLKDGRQSIFKPCPNEFKIDQDLDPVFQKRSDDDIPGMSVEDKQFIQIMDNECHRNPQGNWVMPLPFRTPRTKLPNNRPQAVSRAKSLDFSLKKDKVKAEHFVAFMQRIFDNKHAELAPPLQDSEECWYLPIFGVYHPKKPDQIRGVFDSSAQYKGVSLNDVLLTGPDMTNSLLGILLRFRREMVAITADVEQMFYNFQVIDKHRNFLRFLWYRDNNLDNELTEYRMCVHVFGNSPSPAIATYGLQKIANTTEVQFGSDVRDFVQQDFYVDDGLTSLSSSTEACDLLKRTQEALAAGGNLRLHKIASNSSEVMEDFAEDDLAKNLKDLNFKKDNLPLQRSLGLGWDLQTDSFVFEVSSDGRPATRRKALSTVNSLYDPIGFVSPVTIIGKLLIRDLVSEKADWDQPLSEEQKVKWKAWRDSMQLLQSLSIPRTYSTGSLSQAIDTELHIFSDASELAIAAVAYLVTKSLDSERHIGFVLGKSKVAPKSGHTIPRLELCAAVLAVELYNTISDELGVQFDRVQFHTDSKVVLGYIQNQKRRFFVYVGNRVDRIRRSSSPHQWSYVRSELNPADCATRLVKDAKSLNRWLDGPLHLLETLEEPSDDNFPLLDPNNDGEVRSEVNVLHTHVSASSTVESYRFERFSSWNRLVSAFGRLKRVCRSFKERQNKSQTTPSPGPHLSVSDRVDAENFIIRMVQQETFGDELTQLKANDSVAKSSSIASLNPFLDDIGLLRVGGRLNRSELPFEEKHPIIIPRHHHTAILLVRHLHESVRHQGRHFTEGAVRGAGYWIVGCKRLVHSVIHTCVKCRKLRGKFEVQKMSSLPADRLQPSPPFTFVGVDVFGPWSVVTRRTRGGVANSKRWAVLFTCLTSRAVHIEVVEELSSSAFINALRRFISIRGKVAEFRSDCGTNFVGATDSLNVHAINVESGPVRGYLNSKKAVWLFNAPHCSHMGGVWERMIGVTRRILESIMCDASSKILTHDILTTFMAEVCAIVNSRPLVAISTDPESPAILSPSMLLTQKSDSTVSFVSDTIDLKSQWKRVQTLADIFWKRWRVEFLQTLQTRRKWQGEQPALRPGDLVLLKDKDVCRNDWPTGVIANVIPSADGRIRKAEVCIIKNNNRVVYTRPISELVLLLSDQ